LTPERYCKLCRRELSPQNPGSICVICQGNITKNLDEKSYYDVTDLEGVLGLGADHIRRLGRAGKIPGRIPGRKHNYLKTEVDRWVQSDHLFNTEHPKPVGPLQEEAYSLCQQGDHSWLTEERFIGTASTSETSSELHGNLVKIFTRFTCYFCRHHIVKPLLV